MISLKYYFVKQTVELLIHPVSAFIRTISGNAVLNIEWIFEMIACLLIQDPTSAVHTNNLGRKKYGTCLIEQAVGYFFLNYSAY